MAIATSLGLACRGHIPARTPPFIYCVRKIRRRSASASETLAEPDVLAKEEEPRELVSSRRKVVAEKDVRGPEWKKLSSKDLGIRASMIAKPTRVVLSELKKKGYEVYLVGGCVRDLILRRIPKDFDIITSAELAAVKKTFAACEIVGKRFPICHVHIGGTIVEVSSFSTSRRKPGRGWIDFPRKKPPGCDVQDFLRWKNCIGRDFTINGLMFDPYAKLVYDYMGGMEDIKRSKVRTVIPAFTSFQEDCARILRAVRIAARLGFRFSKETAQSVKNFSCSVLKLDKGRLLMEMNYMLAYGSAEASLRLLWRFGLLELLLPIQAAYFVSQGFRRRDRRSNMLLSLFSNLDRLLAPDRPCHSSLWVTIFAFHKAIVDHPREPAVVAAFSLAIHNGGDLLEAVNIARRISKAHDSSFPELLETNDLDSDGAFINEVLALAASVKTALSMMTDETFVSRAMAKYPQAPYSDLVFISLALYLRASKIFDCVSNGREKGFIPERGRKIDYEFLALGSLQEVRHTFARIVFDTVYPTSSKKECNA
ncbi:hypothetical protein Syun_020154 [Stephania yunnanensis]|uniref:Uncharacterized protein n=1 Tax=Stephania yunnanensis TaxID=152371 RepID=A0AAP0IEP2_9MAGN